MKYAYIKINETIVICNPVPTTIQADHPYYEYILAALEEGRDGENEEGEEEKEDEEKDDGREGDKDDGDEAKEEEE